MKRRIPFDIEFLLERVLDDSRKHMISETPDTVYDKGVPVGSFGDYSSAAFFIFDNCSVLGMSMTHRAIARILWQAHKEEYPEFFIQTQPEHLVVSDWKKFLKELSTPGTSLHKFIKYYDEKIENDETKNFDNLSGNVYVKARTEITISGRVWIAKKIISFWNPQEEVLTSWQKVERFFKEFSSFLGKGEDYLVDGVERTERNPDTPLIPAKQISSVASIAKQSSKAGLENFLSVLFVNPDKFDDLDDTEKKSLENQLHLLSPEKKQKIMKAMGARNIKAANIAEKLGMTVAEFNHIMQVNEEVFPKLTNLVREIVKNKKK